MSETKEQLKRTIVELQNLIEIQDVQMMDRVNQRLEQEYRDRIEEGIKRGVEVEMTLLRAQMDTEIEERVASRLDDLRFLRADDELEYDDPSE